MCRLLRGKNPYTQQVRALRRLVYRIGDTILIVKTGFSKSIVFYTFLVLTGQIIIQLILLSKLGGEQVELIRRYPSINPYLILADIKFQNPRLLEDIKNSIYTYILLRPEQAISPKFRKILQDLFFQYRVRLVAINEYYILYQQEEFRSDFILIYKLRRSLLLSIIFFSYSITIDIKTE